VDIAERNSQSTKLQMLFLPLNIPTVILVEYLTNGVPCEK